METKKKKRSETIVGKWLPNGNMRFYRDDAKKGGCPELQVNHPKNIADTIITAHVLHVIVDYGTVKF